ncbi:MAG: SRPBCC domain-containing protein [Bacteriovoracia bacterium]
MSSFEIRHEVGIKTTPEKLFSALTRPEELARWWTRDTRGESTAGSSLEFWFGDFCQKMIVSKLNPNTLVHWKVTKDGVPEWENTEIEFLLEEDKESSQVLVHFRHFGWKSNTGMLAHCNTKWAVFLLSLKDLAETGTGKPYPEDLQINHY